ncbi:MAG: alginate export family protein [Proteobacteria bacterium]|nr:alginate export family protein [Pseudomonadota bacterium]
MRISKYLVLLATVGLMQVEPAVYATDTLSEAISNGKADLSFRYRYEFVDQDGFQNNANASTLRTRLNFKTEQFKGVTFFLEADNIVEVFADDFNAGAGNSPGRTNYPVVVDPEGTEINQAWVNFAFNGNGVKLGRQRILLDNQRFVGGVGWRQNEQTFDGISGSFDINGSELFVSYIYRINRIFGADVPAGDHDVNTALVNWSKKFNNQDKLTAYYYNIDNENVAAFSTTTIGIKYAGKIALDQHSLSYGAEFAKQSDNGNNLVNYNANYWNLNTAFNFVHVSLIAGYEVLEGDVNRAGAMFRTPLATLHAFNGWADKFLATPQAGIKDLYVGIKGNFSGFKWQVIYHDFSAEDGGSAYGRELDASIGKKINSHISLLLKAAFYEADQFATDTNKIWFMVSGNF